MSYDDGIAQASVLNPPDGAVFFSAGGTGFVYYFPSNPHEVIKICTDYPLAEANMLIEREAYTRFMKAGGHPHVVKCTRIADNGVYLERAANNDLRTYFVLGGVATIEERMQWCYDLADALQFVHEQGVRHADTSGKNVLLDAQRNIKLCDFAGSGIDGKQPNVWGEAGFSHPDHDQVRRATIPAELHALGSTIYEIITSCKPHHEELRDFVIESWFRDGIYPEVHDIPLGGIMLKCWKGEFESAREVADEIKLQTEFGMSRPKCALTRLW